MGDILYEVTPLNLDLLSLSVQDDIQTCYQHFHKLPYLVVSCIMSYPEEWSEQPAFFSEHDEKHLQYELNLLERQ